MSQTNISGSKEVAERRYCRECNDKLFLLFRISLFIFCVFAFIYQAKQFSNLYWSYPEILDIKTETERYIVPPAFTFCESNNVFREHFCKSRMGCGNDNKAKEICMKFNTFCDFGNHDQANFLYSETYLNYGDIKNFGRSLSDVLLYLYKDGRDERMNIEMELVDPFFVPDRTSREIFKCFAINSHVDTYEYPSKFKLSKTKYVESPRQEILKLRFRINLNDSLVPWINPGIYFHIHSPFIQVNPTEEGILLKPGKSYKFTLHLEEEHLLPFPYSSGCINYTLLWEQNNGRHFRSQEMCLSDCQVRYITNSKVCIPLWIMHPHAYLRCIAASVHEYPSIKDDINRFSWYSSYEYNKVQMQTCMLKCKPDCVNRKYPYTFKETQRNHFRIRKERRFRRHPSAPGTEFLYWEEIEENETMKIIDVTVALSKQEILTIRHKPKYLRLELFSCIGGLFGCFLGIYFLAFRDIILIVYIFIKNIFARPKRSLNVCKK